MHLKLIRNTFTKDTTIGDLYIDGKFFCYTLESPDKGLKQNDSSFKIKLTNLFKPSAIPIGVYKVDLNMKVEFGRLLPEIQNVKGYKLVAIKKGSFISHTTGCISIGYKKGNDALFNSISIEQDLIDLLLNEDDITLEITNEDIIVNEFNKLWK